MSDYKYDKEAILDATNDGLDIIVRCYPDQQLVNGSGAFQNFKAHDEKDPSSRVLKSKNTGRHIVKNFSTGDSLSAFDVIIATQAVNNFAEAIQWAVQEFNLSEGKGPQLGGPDMEFKPATDGQKHGDYIFDYHPRLTKDELAIIGPLVTNEIADTFKLKSLKSFTQIKQYYKGDKLYEKYGTTPQQIITKSTDRYPIFCFDYGTWQKIYQPLNKDAKYRFRYVGDKPENFVFGLDSLPALLKSFRKRELIVENAQLHDDEKLTLVDITKKLPAIAIGSGDRDSLNIASMNCPVVWLNSESADLDYKTYTYLMDHTEQLYYLGDIDGPGIEQGVKIALQYINLKVVWLPEWVKYQKYRGKPGKDFKDWIDATVKRANGTSSLISQFNKLLSMALPARFWDAHYDTKGKFKKYTFNNEAAFQFLEYAGFRTYTEDAVKDPYSFVQINKGIVTRKEFHEVANYPSSYVKKKQLGVALLNFLHRSGQLSERMLSKLKPANINFTDSTATSQLYFFKNQIWEITADGIKAKKYSNNNRVKVWEDKVIQHDVHIDKNPFFKITNNGTASSPDYDIEILRNDNHFLNFLINTSRVHWKVKGNKPFIDKKRAIEDLPDEDKAAALAKLEQEYKEYHSKYKFSLDEPGLTPEQVKEQKQHLINKIFCIGYLLHKYRAPNKSWIVYAMDDRVSDVAEANGGSGKSITFNHALKQLLLSSKTIDGADDELYKSSFLFDGITEDTDYVLVDDSDQYFPIKKWKAKVTGDFLVNPKGSTAYAIPASKAPKIAFTTNFGLYQPDSSLKRRLLFYVVSDYYHFEDKGCFNRSHEPADDFGKMLIKNFDTQEHNAFFNLMAQCCQFYMPTTGRINPPEGNIEKRNAIQSIGDSFHEWANSFFYNKKNIYYPRTEAFEAAKIAVGNKLTPQSFRKKLKVWCDIDNLELWPHKSLNPRETCKYNKDGKTVEFIYIKSPDRKVLTYEEFKKVEFEKTLTGDSTVFDQDNNNPDDLDI